MFQLEIEKVSIGMILEKKFTFPGKKIHVPWKKYLQPLEKKFRLLWPCGPLAVWSFGPLVLWSSGCLVLWSCGPLVLWSSGPVVLWSSGPVVLWSCGRVVLWSSGPKILWTASESRSMFCECIWGGGAAPSPPTPLQPGSGWVLKFLFQGINFFFQGLVGVKPLNLFSRGCKFFLQGLPVSIHHDKQH